MILTVAGALFLVIVRLSGGVVAAFLERAFSVFSEKLGRAVGDKIRTFRTGLDTMRSFSDFAAVASLSVAMWVLIAISYLETTQAFVASPPLASMTLAKCVLLMVASGGASVVQLPVVGWFTADRTGGRRHLQFLWRRAGGCNGMRCYDFAGHVSEHRAGGTHLGAS